jgi:hypothetical protein
MGDKQPHVVFSGSGYDREARIVMISDNAERAPAVRPTPGLHSGVPPSPPN